MLKDKVKTVAFDADDTLWVNETFFRESEAEFAELMKEYIPHDELIKELLRTETETLRLYGYGIKGFVLSMLDTALRVSNNKVSQNTIERILELGREQMTRPVELLDGVEEVLSTLHGKYDLILATKGDLIDQERKISESGLSDYFSRIEIMSDKRSGDYLSLIARTECQAENFLMIGNSLRSDILPVLEIGGSAIHVPFEVVWEHERVDEDIVHPNFTPVDNISEVLSLLL